MCENCNSSEKLFYYSEDVPNLPFLNLGNGTYLNTLLQKIDSIIGSEYPFKFSGYSMPYMKGKYSISTMKNFAESTSVEVANLNIKVNTATTNVATNTSSIGSLTNRVVVLEVPGVNDTALAGFTTTSTLKTVLQKLTDKIAEISAPQTTTPLSVISSSTILLTTAGVLNHTLGASLKISGVSGNNIQVKPDGLFVPTPTPTASGIQTLSLNTQGVLSISGGNYVNLPIPVLSLQGSVLSLVNGNSVDLGTISTNSQNLLTVQDSATIDFTITGTSNPVLTGSAKISNNANNQLTNSNGLYVPPANTGNILSEITLTPTYRTTFNDLVKSSNIPLTFFVLNTHTSNVATVNYLDVNNISVVRSFVPAEGGIIQNVKQIITLPTTTLKIDFLGFS
jgi:hypothetical protein